MENWDPHLRFKNSQDLHTFKSRQKNICMSSGSDLKTHTKKSGRLLAQAGLYLIIFILHLRI